jgi:CheY-like chemotaxis protein
VEHFLPAVCYFPTTVLLIDDNRKFLTNIILDLDCTRAIYQSYDDPVEALDFLVKQYQPNPIAKKCIRYPRDNDLDHYTVDVDVRAIHKEIYNPKRFSEISVIIVDYAMPRMTGLELCEALKDTPYKKIMLTCEADENLAVKAFNAGIIDRFVRKDADNFNALINETIFDLQKIYFRELSKELVFGLTKNTAHAAKFLTDPIFMKFFEEVCEKFKISEYYLMDGSGSFVFLDNKGTPRWLAVKNSEEMRELYEFARDEDAPHEILEILLSKEKIPYFHSDEELQTPPSKWNNFLHKAQKLVGERGNNYFYSLITNSKNYTLGAVSSFDAYSRSVHLGK